MNTITVGIPTSGTPQLQQTPDGTLLKNMLIGKDFHWQQTVEALLPGEVKLNDNTEYPVINRLPVETYLECVAGSEMNPDAPEEFLKAHTIISRSWVMGKILGTHHTDSKGKIDTPELLINWEDTCDHQGFDVCSDDHCQRYQGVQPVRPEILKAIRSTAGLVLLSPTGEIVDARFSKCCGGKTELFSSCWQNEERPCLESFDDPWCNLSGLSHLQRRNLLSFILKDYDLINEGGYRWHTEIRAEEIRKNLNQKFGRDIGEILDIRINRRGASGRATLLSVTGTKASLKIGKELMIRKLLAPTHLYSSRIEISKSANQPETFQIEGHGWGHGVGLCQIGAARMALAGHDYRTILSFYYPGSSVGFA